LATTDALTGIANRRTYEGCLEIEWKRMLRTQTSMALILCDIDSFKHYNDQYGHREGDICLHLVAQALRKLLQRPGDIVARYGGEEFIAALPSTTAEGAQHIANNMRIAVTNCGITHENSGVIPYVTVSLGVSQATADAAKRLNPQLLFRAADEALYKAKRQGRNQTVFQAVKVEDADAAGN
jgi:two-component system, cell cycle response regulator